ncbi:tyrosine-protein phosphatase non-receptor type 23 [Microcaecilia unicolor]|uniref:Tyrosine-protein phosphatase non-receptor type 23 n=1 Tax=Microcaecilia unicolor TaxID=1415580 RepID=A0A6P7XAC2_9AMPH|nr:tyrosine-protein phosphatase non-receptor type 23 [Microcaecilia unicolor]
MEAVPRMPMICLDLKEAGEFGFKQAVKQFVLKIYGENPENYNEELKKLEQLRQSAVNVPRDFEGCSILRKYFGQLHYLHSRIPMGSENEAAVPITWTEIFSGKTVTHADIKYEQACILYNLGALHSMLGAMDKRVSEEGMKVSCTHFQCAAGAFTFLQDNFPHSYSVDMSHQILNLNINLMLGQAQECLLEKSMLDNRKSFLVARISAQVVDYYKEACRALENSETASLLGKIQKDWKKLVQMKIYYFAAIAYLHMGKQAEEQEKYGESVAYFQSALDKLNEAIKHAKAQPSTVQDALRFTMDVIGGKYNSAKKDNDFIYHKAVPALDTLQPVKGAPLVKALPVNPTDPAVTGPDIFSKLVPMSAHEASSLYSEEKAKLLREQMSKIDAKNEILEQFTDCLQLDPETVDNLDMYSHIPPVLMEKCAALSVRPDTVKNLVQSMQVLSGVYTDVEASLKEIRDLLDENELQEKRLQDMVGKQSQPQPSSPPSAGVAEVKKEWAKYMEVHEKASFTNTELHKAMNLHISNLRLLSGPLEQLQAALPIPVLTEDDTLVLQNLKRILYKVQEMKEQRLSLEQQLRDTIQKDDITTSLVTTDRSEMKKVFVEELKKYDQVKVYIDQNLAAQENILKALTDANVKYATVRKILTEVEHKWNNTVQTLVSSYEAYEDLMKKSQEGKDFYADLESKVAKLLEKGQSVCEACESNRQQILEKEMKKQPPPRPTAPKPTLQSKSSDLELEATAGLDTADLQHLNSLILSDLPQELRSLPPEMLTAHLARLPISGLGAFPMDPALNFSGVRPSRPEAFMGSNTASAPLQPPIRGQPTVPFNQIHFNPATTQPRQMPHYAPSVPANIPVSSVQGSFPHGTYSSTPQIGGTPRMPSQILQQPSVPQSVIPPQSSAPCSSTISQRYPTGAMIGGSTQPGFTGAHLPPQITSPQHMPSPVHATVTADPGYGIGPQVSASKVLPAGLPPASSVRPVVCPPGPSPFSGPVQGGIDVSQHTVRPSTTTVDSIQGPISSYTAPGTVGGQTRPMFNNQPLNDPTALRSHSAYVAPQRPPGVGQTGPVPYHQSGIQHYVQQSHSHYPSGQAPQMFQASVPIQPNVDMQVRPQVFTAPQQYPPQSQFISQTQPPLPAQHLPVFQPQAQPPMSSLASTQLMPPQFSPRLQNQFPSQHPVLTQIPPGQAQIHPQARPQMYQPQPQDKLPQQGLSGNISFPGALPGGPPQQIQGFPAAMLQQSQQVHSHPSSTGVQNLPAGTSAQVVSGLPFCAGPSARFPGPQINTLPNQVPAGTPMPMLGPQPTVAGQNLPHHVPPSSTPSLSQMPGTVIVPRPPSTPSPAPSPQPSLTIQPPPIMPSSATGSAALPQRPPPSLTPGTAPLSQSSSEVIFHRQSSSTDDLLSSSPESQHGGSKTSVNQPLLQPTKADAKDGQKPKMIQLIENDPYEKPEHIMRLISELERFRNVVNALDKPISGALTELDSLWKDFQDSQEKDARQLSIAIARCYSMKNRHQDIMPYDKNRIVLQSGKDDYINASKVEDLSSYCPAIIATQAPLVGTASDFWLMIHEQKVSLIVMLVSDQEIEKQKVVRYFPTERGQPMVQGPITLTLTSHKVVETHVERMITLQYRDQSLKRTIIHLQFTSWPELGLPDSKGNLLRFIQEVHGHYLHQRPLHTPIVVHCSSGVGRTGAFCLMYAAMQEVEAGNGIPDLAQLVKRMRQQRKHMLQEKLHLKFCYEAILKHVEQVLQRHGVTTLSSSKPHNSMAHKLYPVQDPQDIVLGGDMPISSIQATIAKLSIRPSTGMETSPSVQMPFLSEQASTSDSVNGLSTVIQTLDLPEHTDIGGTEPAPQSPPAVAPLPSTEEPGPRAESCRNHVEECAERRPSAEHSVACIAPSSSSLELLASLTPEAFTLDSSLMGKQKMSKQSFLQSQNGEGLSRGVRADNDPLSMLDPLWTLNKT